MDERSRHLTENIYEFVIFGVENENRFFSQPSLKRCKVAEKYKSHLNYANNRLNF